MVDRDIPVSKVRRSKTNHLLSLSSVMVGGIYGFNPGCNIVVKASGPHPLADQTAKESEACFNTQVQYKSASNECICSPSGAGVLW
jgi:hypothetical protein